MASNADSSVSTSSVSESEKKAENELVDDSSKDDNENDDSYEDCDDDIDGSSKDDDDDKGDSEGRTCITIDTPFHKIRFFNFDDIQVIDRNVDVLKKRMEPVTEDGLVLKEVLKKGTGCLIPDNSLVAMRWSAYFENATEPFISEKKHDPAIQSLINKGPTRGFQEALLTMRKGEKSKFWVHYSYAYGLQGCPPHIPEKANVIYEIDVQNFIDNREDTDIEEIPEDQKKVPFSQVHDACKVQHEEGNKLFKNKDYEAAGLKYLKVMKILEQANVANEKENKERDSLLLKMYLNLSLCHLQQCEPETATIFAQKALNLDRDNPKALYRMGQAHSSLGNFEAAKIYLLRAKHVKPNDELINSALLKVLEQLMK